MVDMFQIFREGEGRSHIPTVEPQDLGIGRLFARVRDAIVVVSVDTGRIVLWNPAAEQLFGYGVDEVFGRPIDLIIPERFRTPHWTGMIRYRATGHGAIIDRGVPVEVPGLHRSGDELPVELSLSPLDAPNGTPYVLAIIRDMRERKRAEDERANAIREHAAREEAEAGQRRMAYVAEASRLLVTSPDPEVALREIARLSVPYLADWCRIDLLDTVGSSRMLTAEAGDADDRRATVWSPQQNDAGIDRIIASVVSTRQTTVITMPGPETLAVTDHSHHGQPPLMGSHERSVLVVPLLTHASVQGTITLVIVGSHRPFTSEDVAIVTDIAARASLTLDNARLLRHAEEAVAVRDEFLAVAAHELKTPVTSLRGFAQSTLRHLDRGVVDLDRVRAAFRTIDQQSLRLSRLVEQLLDVSRLEMGHLTLEYADADIARIAMLAIERAAATATTHQITYTGPTSVPATVDPVHIEQVVSHLLYNAIKFSPDGGHLDLAVDVPSADTVTIAVRDHGVGVPMERRSHLFQPYAGAHNDSYRSGIGMGLYVASQVVALHGGGIQAEFPDDGGTRFVVTLPRTPKDVKDVNARS